MTDTATAAGTDGNGIVVTGKPVGRDPNTLTLIVGGEEITVWQNISLTLRAEGFPNSFSTSMSAPSSLKIKAGDACTVLLGDDKVITGWVDRLTESGGVSSHDIEVTGRGLTQDLVDCGAEWPSHQMIGGDALTIATNLGLPYSIGVDLAEGASAGPQVPQWALNYGETPADIIQRLARNAGLLAYEDARGRVQLANVGQTTAASGIEYGNNVESWTLEKTMDQRFSEYICCGESMDSMMELPGGTFFDKATDPNVLRHRRTYLVLESVADDPFPFTSRKAKWEAARRAGRGLVVTATVDSWRDSAKKLWKPNTLVPVKLPGRSGEPLCLSEVTFRRSSETGTVAILTLMPKEAFVPEPISLVPIGFAEAVGAPEDAPQ